MKRTTTMGAALAAAGLAAVPIADAAKPPAQVKGLTVAAAPNPTVFGRTTAVSGRLSGKNHAGKTVTLQSDPYPYDRFTGGPTTVTAANGDFSFRPRPPVNTRFQVRQGNAQSRVVTVLVRIRTSMRPSDSTPRAGRRVRFSGRACPAHDGATVAVQRRSSTRWRTVKRTKLRSATRCSVYSTRFRVRRDGTYRAVVAGDPNHARGISRRRRVDVHR